MRDRTSLTGERWFIALVDEAAEAERAGEYDRAIELYEAALRRLPASPQEAAPASIDVLHSLGDIYQRRGALDLADDLYGLALAIAEAHGLEAARARVLNAVAAAAHLRGDLPEAERLCREALDVAERIGDRQTVAGIEANLGSLANARGLSETAIVHYTRAAEEYRRLGQKLGVAWTLNSLGMVYIDREDWSRAAAVLTEAGRLAAAERHADTQARVATNLAELHLRAGHLPRAREATDFAFRIFSRASSVKGLGDVARIYGLLHRETGQYSLAKIHFSHAVKLARAAENPLLEAEVEHGWGVLEVEHGDWAAALHRLNRAQHLLMHLAAERDIHEVRQARLRADVGYMNALRVLSDAIDVRIGRLRGSSAQVAGIAVRLMDAAGVMDMEPKWMTVAALLRDLGLAPLPGAISAAADEAPGADERARRHPAAGAMLALDFGFPDAIAQVVRYHHERWDGTGYPEGLAGDGIPMCARIVAVAERYTMLTYDGQPSRVDVPTALRLLEEDAGYRLDPRLVHVFVTKVATTFVT